MISKPAIAMHWLQAIATPAIDILLRRNPNNHRCLLLFITSWGWWLPAQAGFVCTHAQPFGCIGHPWSGIPVTALCFHVFYRKYIWIHNWPGPKAPAHHVLFMVISCATYEMLIHSAEQWPNAQFVFSEPRVQKWVCEWFIVSDRFGQFEQLDRVKLQNCLFLSLIN